jgi:hypothetical protein
MQAQMSLYLWLVMHFEIGLCEKKSEQSGPTSLSNNNFDYNTQVKLSVMAMIAW